MTKRNIYLIAGHGEDDGKMIRDVIRENGMEGASAAYIGTANGEHPMFFERMKEGLLAAGVEKVTLAPLVGRKRNVEKAKAAIRDAQVIFISGGEVEDGMKGLPEDVRAALWEQYEAGALYIGISAGTIMMGKAWPHWDDEDNDFDNAWLFDCIGFVPTVFDTHCEDEGWPELKKAVELSAEGFTGYGIPAGGMVIYTPDGRMESNMPLDPFTNRGGKAVPGEG